MKVKVRNLIELIFQSLVLVLAFIPGFFIDETWVPNYTYSPTLKYYIPSMRLKNRITLSMFDSLFNTTSTIQIVGIALFAAIVGGIVIYAMQFTAKDTKRNWKPTVLVTGAEVVLFAIFSFLIETGDWTYMDNEYRYTLKVMFYVIAVILVVLTAITVWGYIKAKNSGIVEEESKIYKAEIVKEASTTDELKNYKELLDSGVITQEEFDAKKKQLLGL